MGMGWRERGGGAKGETQVVFQKSTVETSVITT